MHDRELRKLHLVRHAESVWNGERRVQGTCPGVLLSERGREQAHLLGKRLRRMEFSAVFSSDAERAVETARIALGEGREISLHPELRELTLGAWEGRLIGELRKEALDQVDLWYRAPTKVEIEGAENLYAFRDRVVSAIDGLIDSPGEDDLLVFTHGGVICTYLTHIFEMDLDDLWSFSLPNASITSIVLDFRPRLSSFGDTAHLMGDAFSLDGMSSVF
ncbi:MAG: histidine phosphatase family protein [Candidatus Krumholzibacteria bacterium]|nr:histidine phosphatase family protein [Candidatus Krumholzibacteria bacterium]